MILLMIFINKSIFFALIICLTTPLCVIASNSKTNSEASNTQNHAISETEKKNPTQEERKILTANRDLGPFFLIGLIINLIMMVSFGFWAYGQFQQNNKKKK